MYRTPIGSYVFPDITAADSAFADGDGVEYYCTATSVFGTIRSRTVRAFYAGEYYTCTCMLSCAIGSYNTCTMYMYER